jgi:arginine-tRNA-protein transferase
MENLDYHKPCNYLPDQRALMKYMLSQNQIPSYMMDLLLENGWRKFGFLIYRPQCKFCQRCIPIRIPVTEFKPSKNQRSLIRKNADIEVRFEPLQFSEEIYQIYLDHNTRFPDQEPADRRQFIRDFFEPACEGIQSMYFINDELIAVGFLDIAAKGTSSVYFIYKTCYKSKRMGTFSILQEIDYTKKMGLKYYYLGYYIAECSRMAYKNHFHPNEKMNWKNMQWETESV